MPAPLLARVLEDAWRSLRGDGATLGQEKIAQCARVAARGGRLSLGKGASFEVGPGPDARLSLGDA